MVQFHRRSVPEIPEPCIHAVATGTPLNKVKPYDELK
jgi:hypothetical protein